MFEQHRAVMRFFDALESEAEKGDCRHWKSECIPLRVDRLREKLEACFQHLNTKESNVLGQGAFLGDLKAMCKVSKCRW
jgi:hypothetical protein